MKKVKNKNRKKIFDLKNIILIIAAFIIILLVILNRKNQNWTLDGNKVYKGKEVYEIGDYYEYDETNGGVLKDLIDVKWKVLGVSDEGNLLIVSSSNVEELTLGSTEDIEKCKKDYIDGEKRLNEISQKYAKGKNAISGRSINLDDINKITKVKEDVLKQSEVEISYYWGKEKEPITVNEKTGEKATIKIEHKGEFLWFDNIKNEWNISKKNGNETNDNMKKIITLKNDHIAYNYEIYHEEIKDFVPFISKDTKEYKMLFTDDINDKVSYWISTKFISATQRYAAYGYNVVKSADINYNYIIYSAQVPRESTFGIRPVIEIK